mmetsp:Transcript_9461/g.14214  ORF Transcript_9461/g.14214 Transcript_9461/m.14214 type:complete len:202 (-) Transcript_9461:1292-1897(-)
MLPTTAGILDLVTNLLLRNQIHLLWKCDISLFNARILSVLAELSTFSKPPRVHVSLFRNNNHMMGTAPSCHLLNFRLLILVNCLFHNAVLCGIRDIALGFDIVYKRNTNRSAHKVTDGRLFKGDSELSIITSSTYVHLFATASNKVRTVVASFHRFNAFSFKEFNLCEFFSILRVFYQPILSLAHSMAQLTIIIQSRRIHT